MPGHTFVYSPPVNKVKDLIRAGELGEVYFVTSSRMNLGKYQPDGVICDLAPHDLSILLYLLDEPVVSVSASARNVYQAHVPEVAFLTLTFASGTTANVQISWLAPRKVREMVIVGSRRMVQYDDTAADESVRVFDRGMELAEPSNFGEFQLSYRTGDIVIPRVEAAEPLSLELQDFARAILTGQTPRSHAELGYEIVRRSRPRSSRWTSAASRSCWTARRRASPPERALRPRASRAPRHPAGRFAFRAMKRGAAREHRLAQGGSLRVRTCAHFARPPAAPVSPDGLTAVRVLGVSLWPRDGA